MYKVSSQLNSSYGEMELPKKAPGPDMPHVTVGDKRMTNIAMGNGEYIQGIRRNRDIGVSANQMPGEVMSCQVPGLRPLRYTPGLTCDAQLEALRPERNTKHPALSGNDQWKKKLIQTPTSYDGSFGDANMQNFRPVPNVEDQWMSSRLPDNINAGIDRLSMPAGAYYAANTGNTYDQIYPADELSQIKMRNRRFQNSCGLEYNRGPMMRGQPMFAPMGYPQQQQQQMMMQQPPQMMMMMSPSPQPQGPINGAILSHEHQINQQQDELALLDQELNMTRRATRPFMPTSTPEYHQLQKQIDLMEQEPMISVRKPCEPITTVEQLPPPKKVIKAPLTEACAPPARSEVRIADQIAIRSYVLGQNMPRIGGSSSNSNE